MRMYAVRRIRDAFRENKSVKDPVEIQALVNKAKRDLEIIRRQVLLSSKKGRVPELVRCSDASDAFISQSRLRNAPRSSQKLQLGMFVPTVLALPVIPHPSRDGKNMRSAVTDGFEASSPQMPKTGARIYECLFQRQENLARSFPTANGPESDTAIRNTLLHKRVWDECDGLSQLTAEAFGILIHPTFYYGKGQSTFLHILEDPFSQCGDLGLFHIREKTYPRCCFTLGPVPTPPPEHPLIAKASPNPSPRKVKQEAQSGRHLYPITEENSIVSGKMFPDPSEKERLNGHPPSLPRIKPRV
ncbi:hypothetical protein U0070_009689 [Myodes glareolus]|uniref:Complex 1 LYR protein domain-containing protein n=1 Tax=Myodes glareolus TaxID=447135 RepID=A0AAW0HP93_MYOGA